MTANGLIQIGLYMGVLLFLVKPLGGYMARVYEGSPFGLDRVLGPVERLIYRMFGIRPEDEMSWKSYASAAIVFKIAFFFLLYLILRLQDILPLNPQGFGGVSSDLAFNTAVSFITNTNWQAYGGESTMSYLTQMMGLSVQNFVSAAQGMAILVALIRGFTRRSRDLSRKLCLDIEFYIKELQDIIRLSLKHWDRFFPFSLFKPVKLEHEIDLKYIG